MRLEQQCVLQALAALHHHFKVVPAKALLVGFHPDVRFHHRGAGAQPSRLVAVERLLSRLWFPACLLAEERARIVALFNAQGEVAT